MKCHFPHPFSDLEVVTKRNITCLHKTEIMWSLERLKQQQKYFLKSISNSHITLSLFLHLEWKRRTHMLIHNRSSFVNHTRFQTGPDTRFQNKTGQKPYPLGRHKPLLYGLFTGEPPPPPPPPKNALCINEFIIRRLNPFVVVDFSFISAPLHT